MLQKQESSTHHLIVPQPLCGLYGPVQAGFTEVHVLGVGVLGQELHQSPNIHVVVIIYVTEPPKKQKENNYYNYKNNYIDIQTNKNLNNYQV